MSVVQSHMAAIKHCYEKELRKDPELSGTVTVGFTVGARGTVTEAAVKQSTLKNKEVEGCMIEDIKGWIFPEPRGGQPVPITYPFKFKAPSS
jgi:TonB family protein